MIFRSHHTNWQRWGNGLWERSLTCFHSDVVPGQSHWPLLVTFGLQWVIILLTVRCRRHTATVCEDEDREELHHVRMRWASDADDAGACSNWRRKKSKLYVKTREVSSRWRTGLWGRRSVQSRARTMSLINQKCPASKDSAMNLKSDCRRVGETPLRSPENSLVSDSAGTSSAPAAIYTSP